MGTVGFPAAGLGGVLVVWGLGCIGGVSMVFLRFWCCLGGVSVVSRGVSVVLVFRRCVDDVSVVSLVSVVSWWCLGGVSAASMLIQGVHGVLVVSGRRRVGGVGAVVLVVRWLCHAPGTCN